MSDAMKKLRYLSMSLGWLYCALLFIWSVSSVQIYAFEARLLQQCVAAMTRDGIIAAMLIFAWLAVMTRRWLR